MAPEHTAYLTVPVHDPQELLRIAQTERVQPRAAHGQRMMVYADQGVLQGMLLKCCVQAREAGGSQGATDLALQVRACQDQTPPTEAGVAADLDPRPCQAFLHQLRIVVVARDAIRRRTEGFERLPETPVPGPALVVNDVSGDHDGVRRPARVVLGVREHRPQGGLGIDAAVNPVHSGKEVSVRDLQQHDGTLAAQKSRNGAAQNARGTSHCKSATVEQNMGDVKHIRNGGLGSISCAGDARDGGDRAIEATVEN